MARKQQKLKICLVSSEMTPLAKTGGLADVSSALTIYLRRAGHDIRPLIPCYARIERSGLNIRPVEGLTDLRLRMGTRQWRYSIGQAFLPGTRVTVYLLQCREFFGRDSIYTQDYDEYLRFVMLSRAALEMCQRMDFAPHILHCNDWHTGLIPLYLRMVNAWDKQFANTRSVMTIHNIGYQGVFSSDILPDLDLGDGRHLLHQDDLRGGRINFLKTALLYSDLVTTVSPTYAREIQGEQYGMGLDALLRERSETVVGILNGVDYDEWNPETDRLLPATYSADDLSGKGECKERVMHEMGLDYDAGTPLIGIVSRLVGQKGIELIQQAIPTLMTQRRFSIVVLGSGEHRYESFFEWLQHHFRGRAAFYNGYNEKLAHWIEAGSDMFLMPSLYEPCGLNQMYSLKYGTVPIVRETGGLADSVEQIDPDTGAGTGILFRDYDARGLLWAVSTALDLYDDRALWQKVIQNGMARDFSWERQAAVYIDLFRRLSDLN